MARMGGRQRADRAVVQLTPASRPAPQAQANGIIIDLSHGIAEVLGSFSKGTRAFAWKC
jgi:hypothetical protein